MRTTQNPDGSWTCEAEGCDWTEATQRDAETGVYCFIAADAMIPEAEGADEEDRRHERVQELTRLLLATARSFEGLES